MSNGFNCILVIVDRLSKYAHFVRIKYLFTTFQLVTLFINEFFRLHGITYLINSD